MKKATPLCLRLDCKSLVCFVESTAPQLLTNAVHATCIRVNALTINCTHKMFYHTYLTK